MGVAADPTSQRSRARVVMSLLGGVGVVLVALYIVVLSFYSSGRSLTYESVDVASPDVTIAFDLIGIEPTEYSGLLRSQLIDVDSSFIDQDERLVKDVRVGVWSEDGADELFFAAGSLVSKTEAVIGIQGDIWGYPFDTYETSVEVDAFARESADAPWVQLTIQPEVVGGIAGWDVVAVAAPQEQGWVDVMWTAERAFSQKFFAILTVALGLSIAVFSLLVGVLGVARYRSIEAGVLGFGAAVIFSLLALRNYLPGQPPIGIGLDIYFYVWVTLTAFMGMALIVVAWTRQKSRRPQEGNVAL